MRHVNYYMDHYLYVGLLLHHIYYRLHVSIDESLMIKAAFACVA